MRGFNIFMTLFFSGGLVVILSTFESSAQNTISPATDWNGNYNFSSTADRTLRMLQADMIEKREQGYYESLGKTTVNQTITNNTTNTTEIGQNTNAIGSVNNTTTNIDLSGDNNNIDISSTSTSNGCQDGSVNIGQSGSNSSASGCR